MRQGLHPCVEKAVSVGPMYADGTRVYATLINNNSVAIINTGTNAVTTFSDGSVPIAVAVSPDGSRLYVASAVAVIVCVINTATNAIVGTPGVGTGPRALAVTADGSRVYVASDAHGGSSGSVSVIKTSDQTVTTISTGGRVYGIALDPDGTLAYATNNNGQVWVIDANPASPTYNTVIATISTGGSPDGVVVSPNGTAYVANAPSNKLSVVSLVPSS